MLERAPRRIPPRSASGLARSAWLALVAAAGLALVWLLLRGHAPFSGALSEPHTLGHEVDPGRAQSLSQLAHDGLGELHDCVVRAEVAAVCSSSGCWVTLREVTRERVWELYGDLASADFRAPRELAGRTATVVGTLRGREPDWVLDVRGMRWE